MSDNEWEYDSEGYCSGDDSVLQRHAERDRAEEQEYLEEEYKEQAAHHSKESASDKETADIEASVKKLALSSRTEQASLSPKKDVTGGDTMTKVTVSASHTPSATKDVSESKEGDAALTIDKLLKFCQEQNISTKGVLMITIQKNLTDQFSSFVVDLENRETFPVYPQPSQPFQYQEKKVNGFNICYYGNLSRPPAAVRVVPTVCESPPFCCDGIVGHLPKTLDRSKEEMFKQLLARQGSVPGIVFSVRRQIDNGTEMVTQYFMLEDGKLTEVFGTFQNKVHAFKNYKCKTHGLFFGVDLYRSGESVGTNKHHMRLNPFTQLNDAFLSEFFRKCLKEPPVFPSHV